MEIPIKDISLDFIPNYSQPNHTDESIPEISPLSVHVFNIGTVQQKNVLEVTEKDDDCLLRCVCISDTHCRHRLLDIPDGDVLIHCGRVGLYDSMRKGILLFQGGRNGLKILMTGWESYLIVIKL